jgi:hypothetical protein
LIPSHSVFFLLSAESKMQHGNKESSEGCQIPAMEHISHFLEVWQSLPSVCKTFKEQFFKLTRVWRKDNLIHLLKLYFFELSESKIIPPMEKREWDHNSTGSISSMPPIVGKYFTRETDYAFDSATFWLLIAEFNPFTFELIVSTERFL